MYTPDHNNYDDAMDLVNCCVSCLKNSGKTEDVLFELLKSFKADDAVFLSANDSHMGVNLTKSYVLCKDRKYLNQYADFYWQQDPLYQMQFCSDQNIPVFKTDDVIPYSQLVNLEYYDSFLRPQNVLGELIIRICSQDRVLGALSLQRHKDHRNFDKQDIQKASIIAPFLNNFFEFANSYFKINNERLLFEQWMDSRSEGIILLDYEFKPLFSNSQARYFCFQMNVNKEKTLSQSTKAEISIPYILIQDCQNLVKIYDRQSHSNRFVNFTDDKRYYIQCFPIILSPAEQTTPHFIIFINELSADFKKDIEIYSGQYKLSKREEIIAQYAAEGLTNKQIADKLCISPFTVQNHLKSIFEKTGLDSRTKLANLMKY
jgi:DNA-binding CsgD family transcriptional regulator